MADQPSGRAEEPPAARIRPLTVELIPELIGIHRAAYAQFINARLGDSYVHAFLNWFRNEPDAVALVAVDREGHPYGYVVGAEAHTRRARNRALLAVVVRNVLLRPWLLADRRLPAATIGRVRGLFGRAASDPAATPLPLPRLDLVSIAVGPSSQRRGSGTLLIQEFERVARGRGMRSMRLFVKPNNAPARRVYERAGWGVLDVPVTADGLLQYAKLLD